MESASGTLKSNVFDTALVFEGGSMRAAYTSAVANVLLENGICFDQVYGTSAGSSNAVNYLSRDMERIKASFTTFAADQHFGGMGTWLRHRGAFNAHYIYQECCYPGAALPFDFSTFSANPAGLCIAAIDRDTGRDLFFTRDDMTTLDDLMVRVRASSTLPCFMPPPQIEGAYCYDGGFASGGGISLDRIEQDGFQKMFVVRTHPRGYRKTYGRSGLSRLFFWHRPRMQEAAVTRWSRYNDMCDRLDRLEAEGRACVFYCEDLTLSGTERDVGLLLRNYEAGYNQMKRDLPVLERFLGS